MNIKHSDEFIAQQKNRLLELHDDLIEQMHGAAKDSLKDSTGSSESKGSGIHQGDSGSDACDREQMLHLLSQEQDAIYEIQDALQRIEQGLYGICEATEELIPQKRLEVIPFARFTVQAQEEFEKKNGGAGRYHHEDPKQVGFPHRR